MSTYPAATVGVSALVGAVAGFLTRPCCVGPAALSVLGVSSAGVSAVAETYRSVFVSLGMVMVVTSMWITFRRDGGRFNKCLAAGATVATFVWAIERLGL